MQLAGQDGMRFLQTTDPVERIAMQLIASAVDSLEHDRGQSRANQIANAVGEMLNRK